LNESLRGKLFRGRTADTRAADKEPDEWTRGIETPGILLETPHTPGSPPEIRELRPVKPIPQIQRRGLPDNLADNAVDPVGGSVGNRRRPQGGSGSNTSRLAPTLNDRSTTRTRLQFLSISTTPWLSRRSAMVGSRTRHFVDFPVRLRSASTPWALATSYRSKTRTCRPTISSTRCARRSIGFPPQRSRFIARSFVNNEGPYSVYGCFSFLVGRAMRGTNYQAANPRQNNDVAFYAFSRRNWITFPAPRNSSR
jgi:hypothetical protein